MELFAPHNIEKEVVNTLKNRLSDPLKRNVAFCHAKKLLLKVKKVSRLSSKALLLAKSVLGSVDQGDVPYLAVSIDTGSDAILSHDKRAFDSQTSVKRYDMGKAAALILTYHEGGFAIVISSAAIDVALRTLAKLMAVLFNTIVEITGFVVQLIGAIIKV